MIVQRRMSKACDAGAHDTCEREHVVRGVTGCAVLVQCGCDCAHVSKPIERKAAA